MSQELGSGDEMSLREAVRDINQRYDIPENERLRELARSNAHLQD